MKSEIILGEYGSGGGNGIDMNKYVPSSEMSQVNKEGVFTLSVPSKPNCVIVTYLMAGTSYFRNDICDLVGNKVLSYFRSSDGTTYQVGTPIPITDEVSYNGTTLTIKNKTNGVRQMCAVAFY